MKLGNLSMVAGAFVLAMCLQPNVGWSTRAYASVVTGEVTAAPHGGEIEIAHHLYRVRANSAAAQAINSFYVGQTVDAILDGPPGAAADEIIHLTIHAAP